MIPRRKIRIELPSSEKLKKENGKEGEDCCVGTRPCSIICVFLRSFCSGKPRVWKAQLGERFLFLAINLSSPKNSSSGLQE